LNQIDAKPRGTYVGHVAANELICTEHYRLTIRLAEFPCSWPGQFVQIACDGVDVDECAAPREMEWEPGRPRPSVCDRDFLGALPYLRRPFSIARRVDLADGQVDIDIIHRVVGKGTRYLQKLREGDAVSVLGPLGKGFSIPENLELGLLVGGGVGIPPMFYLAEAFAAAGKPAVAFVGAQRSDLVPLSFAAGGPLPSAEGDPVINAGEFAKFNFPTVISTDDGSLGFKGFVTGALTRFVEQRPTLDRTKVVVYCCGPTPMMKATAKVATQFGFKCQVSLEQPMACGMGTCQSCVIRYQPANATDWVYKLTCTDGPVFDSADIRW
jgi:dihydroorotate dehydrogenase electron transfer subunit